MTAAPQDKPATPRRRPDTPHSGRRQKPLCPPILDRDAAARTTRSRSVLKLLHRAPRPQTPRRRLWGSRPSNFRPSTISVCLVSWLLRPPWPQLAADDEHPRSAVAAETATTHGNRLR